MRWVPVLFVALVSCGCSYGPRHEAPTACSVAEADRLAVTTDVAGGAIASALQAIERANAACPERRRQTRGDEVKLLAELGRCGDARALAAEIDTDADRSDGAWLSASVARGQCDREASNPPSVGGLIADAETATANGDDAAARRSYDRAIALAKVAHLDIRVDCTHWGHRGRSVAAYVPAADGVLLVEHDHALLLSAIDGHELRFFGHGKPVEKTAVSASGRTVATASADDVLVWSLDDAGPIARAAGHGPLAVSADGAEVAYIAVDGALVRASSHGEPRARIALSAKPTAIAFSEEGLAISLDDGTFRVFDAAGAQRLRASHDAVKLIAPRGAGSYLLAQKLIDQNIIVGADVMSRGATREVTPPLDDVFAIDPTGATLATERSVDAGNGGSSSQLVLHDVSTGHVVEIPWRTGSREMAISAGGDRVFSFDRDDDLVVFTAATETSRVLLPAVSAQISEFSVAGDGKAMVIDFSGTGGPFDRPRWSQIWTASGVVPLRTKSYPVMTNDSRFVVDQSTSGDVMRFAIYDARTAQPLTVLVAPKGKGNPEFSPSGRFAVYYAEGGSMRADLERRVEPALVPGRFISFAADDSLIVEGAGHLFLDPSTLRPLENHPGGNESFSPHRVDCVDESRDCVKIVRSGSYDANTARIDLTYVDAEGQAFPFEPYAHQPNTWGAPASGRFVAVAYQEGTVLFYDGHGGKPVMFHPLARAHGGWAVAREGTIELFGDAAAHAVCRIGTFSAPISACPDLVATGLLASFLR